MGCNGCVAMRKWILIFLLLANALLFMGYTLIKSPAKSSAVENTEAVLELKLLSEVPVESLVKKQDLPSTENSNGVMTLEEECYQYQGLETEQEADEVVAFFAEQGINAVIFLSPKESEADSGSSNLQQNNGILVQVGAVVDRNLINRINKVLIDSYKLLNIEKKVCKGVASEKRDK